MSYPVFKANSSWFTPTVADVTRSAITVINIVDTYTPSGTVTDSWDASVAQDGGITVYVEDTTLTISGNGSGKLSTNADASFMFSDINKSDYFDHCTNINGGDLLDLSGTTNMFQVFRYCNVLKTIDVSQWDTSACTNMIGIFNGCLGLEELDVSNWNTSSATSMKACFQLERAANQGRPPISRLDVSKWDTSNVTDMSYMFYGMGHLTELDVSNFKTGNVTTTDHMFCDNFMLPKLDVSKWDTSNVTNFNCMFNGCRAITEIDVSGFDVSKAVTLSQMFEDMQSLERIDGLENWDTSACRNFGEMFRYCYALKTLDLGSFDTQNADNTYAASSDSEKGMHQFFGPEATALESVKLGSKFTFLGNGNCVNGYLPASSADTISGADGNWYDLSGTAYATADIPNLTANTYCASLALVDSAIRQRDETYITYRRLEQFRDLMKADVDEVFVVHFTWDDDDNVQADHTPSEIWDAIQAGKHVVGIETYDEWEYGHSLIGASESKAYFRCIYPDDNYISYNVLSVTDDGVYAYWYYGASYYHYHTIDDIDDLEETLSELTDAAEADGIDVYKATIGTTWEDDETTGAKTQTIPAYGVFETDTVVIDCMYDGDHTAESYAAFAEQQDQYLTHITNGFSETVDDGLKFTIFGDANTVDIPILLEVIHHEPISYTYRPYLTFSSPETFSISVSNPGWDGTMEYSTDKKSWHTWDGSEISGTALYLRGIGNTKVTGSYDNSYKWTLTGSNIACTGNIETLLDYKTVTAGNHPTMANYCYDSMFYGCTGLTVAPELPATTLADRCYDSMFYGCTGLTVAPELPATTLADRCYDSMFYGCTGLTTAPELPATTLEYGCYSSMFQGCTGLTTAPELPATTLAGECYANMFSGCTNLTAAPELPVTTLASECYKSMFYSCISLTTAPELPAITLAYSCYSSMFQGCTGLTTAPELPATKLATLCYFQMFFGCTSLTGAPALPATTLANNCYENMFVGCTAITEAPELPATTLAEWCYYQMFLGCTSLTGAPALPATTLKSSCYNKMFVGCTSLKFSADQTDEYTQTYRIPASGEGTTADDALANMFIGTGGTFVSTPEINVTYYLHKDCSIV